jgi:CRISPR-associated protein Cas5h
VALVFDVSAEVAMFRKAYTTTSQVSFPFPPPTAVAGLLAAIVGLDHNAAQGSKNAAFWPAFEGTRVAIGIKNPLRWFSTTVNLLKYKSPNGNLDEHIQSKHQLVKNPCYRIYVSGGQLCNDLRKRLERQEFIFTPYLGVAYALADIAYLGEYDEAAVDQPEIWVDTVVPLYAGVQLDIAKCGGIHRELVPFRLDSQRELKETVAVVYADSKETGLAKGSAAAGRLWLSSKGRLDVSQVGTERVSWFERW